MLKTKIVIATALLTVNIATAGELKPLYSDTTPVRVVLSAPLSQAYAHRDQDERLFLPGFWSYVEGGETYRLSVLIRTRGRFRRRECALPPLQLNFKKSEVKDTLFAGQDKLKLVTPCDNSRRADQGLLREYLIYRVFDVVADGLSFGTRLLDLNYLDTDKKRKPWSDAGFVIESTEDLAKRVGLKEVEVRRIKASQLDPVRASIVELFQFMIGNPDYSLIHPAPIGDCCHNTKLFEGESAGQGIVPIPYDFDSTGLVNASYSAPAEDLNIRSVTQRIYLGHCRDQQYLDDAIALFSERREAIMAVFTQTQLLDEKYRKRSVNYLQGFFDIIDDPKAISKKISSKCIG